MNYLFKIFFMDADGVGSADESESSSGGETGIQTAGDQTRLKINDENKVV